MFYVSCSMYSTIVGGRPAHAAAEPVQSAQYRFYRLLGWACVFCGLLGLASVYTVGRAITGDSG